MLSRVFSVITDSVAVALGGSVIVLALAGPVAAVPLFLEGGGGCLVACPALIPGNKLTVPMADLVKVQDPQSEPAGNGRAALEDARTIFGGATVPTGNGITDFTDMIAMAFAANGNMPVSVVLIGHGAPGVIDLGSQDLDMSTAGTFGTAAKGMVSSLTLFSCSTGAGAAGAKFGRDLSKKLGGTPVMAYDSCIAIDAAMFFAVGGDAAKQTFVPEPAGLALLGIGVVALSVATQKRRRA